MDRDQLVANPDWIDIMATIDEEDHVRSIYASWLDSMLPMLRITVDDPDESIDILSYIKTLAAHDQIPVTAGSQGTNIYIRRDDVARYYYADN